MEEELGGALPRTATRGQTEWRQEKECVFAGNAFKRDEYPAVGIYGGGDCGQLSSIPSDTRRQTLKTATGSCDWGVKVYLTLSMMHSEKEYKPPIFAKFFAVDATSGTNVLYCSLSWALSPNVVFTSTGFIVKRNAPKRIPATKLTNGI